MKILHVQNTDWLARNPAQQHHLLEMLSLRGHEVRVIDFELLWRKQGKRGLTSRRQVFEKVSKIHPVANITVIRPPVIQAALLDYISYAFSCREEVNRQIREFKPDIITGLGFYAYIAGRAARAHNVPFLHYWIDVSHRLIPPRFKFLQPLGWLIERGVVKLADRTLAINDKLRDYVIGMGAPPDKTQVLRAGITLGKFDPSLSTDSIRKEHGLKREDQVLFFMGWLYHFAGLKEMMIELAKSSNPNLKLLIVGEGDAYNDLCRLRERCHLEDRVILTGKKSYQEIPSFIAAADVCLLPSYPWEPIMHDIVPIKLYEYMAMQKPVVSTRLPGVVREFGEGNGMVYVDKPEDALARAVELMESGRAGELGLRARKFVEKNSWDKIADEFERILAEMVQENRKNR